MWIRTHYNTPRHTATHCNTLQHTATHTHVSRPFTLGLTRKNIRRIVIVLQGVAMNIVLQCVAEWCSALQCVAVWCSALQFVASPVSDSCLDPHSVNEDTLHHTTTHCNTLQHSHTVSDSCLDPHSVNEDTLHHTTTHCNTLQHTATLTHCLRQLPWHAYTHALAPKAHAQTSEQPFTPRSG